MSSGPASSALSPAYEKMANMMKYTQFFNAGALACDAILHFVFFPRYASYNHFVFTIYLFLFAAIFVGVELSKFRTRTWFYFMNFAWGKAAFLFFVGLILVVAGKSVIWVDILVGVWFIICGLIYGAISKKYPLEEQEYVKDKLHEVE